MAGNGFDQWGGYMEAKITKLEEQFTAASDSYRKSDLFAGISIYVNGLTDPSAEELKRMMMVHGGIYHHYERSHTKFIIASNLPDVKVRNMNTSNVISPQWVVDCIKEKRLLDFSHYLLYTNRKTSQPRLMFKCRKKEESLEGTAEGKQEETEEKLLTEQKQTETKLSQTKQISLPDTTVVHHSKQSTSSTSNVARTAVDPKFLSEFYNNSRLHHIATLGAGFKQYVTELREKHGARDFPAREALKARLAAQDVTEVMQNHSDSYIMHIDMDCFFVSVGLRTHPELRGYPIAVTHSKGGTSANNVPVHPSADRQAESELFAKRFEQHLHNNILSDKVRGGFDSKMSLSEIASCSYEARAKGIRNGMFMGHALKLCPDLKTIPYDFEGYREVAYTLYDTIAQYTLNIEAISCDEMFVDLNDVLIALKVRAMDFVRAVREEVREKTGCPCSAGVGSNKLQARMATKHAKPDGQYQLLATDVQEYMANIPIEELPGVGSSTSYTLKEVNLLTCGDLQKISLVKIQMHVGKKLGETLYKFCRGIDDRPLNYEKVRKSVSAEVNYGIRFTEYIELEKFLQQLCTEVHTRLSDIKRRTKCITLKLMVRSKEAPLETAKFMGHGVCDNITKSVSLSEFTCNIEVITRTVLTTMKALALPPKELRGIGITLSKLDDPNEGKERKENVIKNMFTKVMEKQKDKNSQAPDNARNDNMPINEISKKSPKKVTSPKKIGSPKKAIQDRIQSKPMPHVLKMLQNCGVKTQNSGRKTNNEMVLPPDIDPEVFAELPYHIRTEILNEYAVAQKCVPAKSVQVQEHSEETLNQNDLQPSTSKAALQRMQERERTQQTRTLVERVDVKAPSTQLSLRNRTEEKARNKISEENIFMLPNCISLLLHWVKSDAAPESDDVELLGKHACELVHADELDRLYNPLIYLCRLINQQRGSAEFCAWHAAYREIVLNIQLEMQDFYNGKKLFLSDKLKCDKCKLL